MTKYVGIQEAKTHLSQLLVDIVAGEEVVITRRGKAVARLVPACGSSVRRLGVDRGRFEVPEDFDAPLPDDVLAAFD